MDDRKELNLLNEQLDEESQKYIQESLETWKESVTSQLVEQMEQEKQAKLEELEEQNNAYREALKEEFAEKMLDGLNELKESIRAEVTAEVIKNNPELKVLETVKTAIAPLVSEGYRDGAYSDTIERLSKENEKLKRDAELEEGAKTLASLIAPYSENVQNLFLSMIEEGNPDEVTESFMKIYDSISNIIEADETDDETDDEDSDDETDDEYESDDEDDSDDDEDSDEDDDSDSKGSKKENKDDDSDGNVEESYIQEGFSGLDDKESANKNYNSLKAILSEYARS